MSSTLIRQVARSASRLTNSKVRTFASSSVARKDLVQDIYLKEIRAYKPTPVAKDAHVGAVRTYSAPPSPNAPSLPTDLAAELSAYDATEPTKAELQLAHGEAASAASGADAFLSFLEQDEPKHEEAHH